MKTEQQKEIESIRGRTVVLELSDADCERISNLCGEHNITVATLLESFIGDLVNGTYTNGSDERDYARSYFERCWFGMYPEKSLLNFLLSMGYDVYDDLICLEDSIIFRTAELAELEDEGEIEYIKEDIVEWKDRKSVV